MSCRWNRLLAGRPCCGLRSTGLGRLAGPGARARLRAAIGCERGSGTVSGLMWTLAALMIIGLSLDGANGRRIKVELQVATDAAALAGVLQLPDTAAAVAEAQKVAAMNLGSVTPVSASDIQFGKWDEATRKFTPTLVDPDAMRVSAGRDQRHDNPVPTYLMRFIGWDSWNVGTGSLAVARLNQPPPPGTPNPHCTDATILSTGMVRAGGHNSYMGNTCVYGRLGVRMGGNDYFDPGVRIQAATKDMVQIGNLRSGSASPEAVTSEGEIKPRLLPKLNQMWADRWALYSGTGKTYSGDLFPAFLKDSQTNAINIVRKSGNWTVKKGDLQPYTLYLVDGGAQLSGGVEGSHVGFMVNGDFGVGGGPDLSFTDTFIMGQRLNLAGNITWGDKDTTCNGGRYSVYTLGLQSLSLGGWGRSMGVWGVVGAAPDFNPGGAMTGSGVYFETSGSSTQLGGNMTLNGCDDGKPLDSAYDLWRPEPEEVQVSAHDARLVQ